MKITGRVPYIFSPSSFWCRSFDRVATTGHFQDLPPNFPLWKACRFYKELMEVGDILAEGKESEPDKYGVRSRRPYSSLEEAANDHKRIDEICKLMHITSYKSLWRLLRQADPSFIKANVTMVGQRDPEQAQDAAKQLCGRKPMGFEHVTDDPVLKHHPLMERFMQPAFQFVYMMAQLVKNIFLDAAKIDPQRWAKQRSGIMKKGKTNRGTVAVTHVLQKLSV